MNGLTSVFFTGSNTGYAAGDNATMLKTTDAGMTWNALPVPTNNGFTSVYFPEPDIGYAVTSNILVNSGGLLKTTNGGASWYKPPYWNLGGFYQSVCFINRDTGFIAGGDYWVNLGIVLKTMNGGFSLDYSWHPLSNQPHAYLNSIFFPDANTGYVAGDYGSVLKTADGGATWFPCLSITNNSLRAIHFTDANTGYAVGLNGTILKTTNGGGIPVGVKDAGTVTEYLKIYPNPSDNIITIADSGISDDGQLVILDMQGKEVMRQRTAGSGSSIDIRSLRKGLYFVKLTGDGTINVSKFIKE
jgi:photosystem II stability/assembly factor-like uncharacterized protein